MAILGIAFVGLGVWLRRLPSAGGVAAPQRTGPPWSRRRGVVTSELRAEKPRAHPSHCEGQWELGRGDQCQHARDSADGHQDRDSPGKTVDRTLASPKITQPAANVTLVMAAPTMIEPSERW